MSLWHILFIFKKKKHSDIIKENFRQYEEDRKAIIGIVQKDISDKDEKQEKLYQRVLSLILFFAGLGLFIYDKNSSKEIGLFIAGTGLYGFIPESKSEDKKSVIEKTVMPENRPEGKKIIIEKTVILAKKTNVFKRPVMLKIKPKDKKTVIKKTVILQNKPEDKKVFVKKTVVSENKAKDKKTASSDSRWNPLMISFLILFMALGGGVWYLCKQQLIQILCVLLGMFLMCFLNIFKRFY